MEKYQWTNHSLMKMKYYRLSQQRIKRVIKNPERIEEGIVEKTIASMQTSDSSKCPYEIWTMYQIGNFKSKIPNSEKIQSSKFKVPNQANRRIRIISAWKYPGTSPKNNPIPEEILKEIRSLI